MASGSDELVSTAKLLVIYTGGTIGMKPTPTGLQPVKGYLPEYLAMLPQFHDREAKQYLTTPKSRFGRRIQYEIKEWDELLDSSNLNQGHYRKIVCDIEENYEKYDAFIIMHGTDTMAYTASALSFMLENLSKTVILTGSQVPFAQEPNDAAHNLLMSLTIAGHFEIPEVCIYFDHKLLRGNRSRKVSALDFDAFNSLNLPALVKVGTEMKVNWNVIRPPPPREEKVVFHKELSPNVGVLKLFPGVSDATVRNFLQPPLEGCVLETYGTGNAPSNRPEFLNILKEASKRGVFIVNVTQCHKGTVSHGTYATSSSLAACGVLSGYDMTTEAALAKISYLLTHGGLSPLRIRELIGTNIRGELTSEESVKFSFHDESFLKSVAMALHTSGKKNVPPIPLVSLRASSANVSVHHPHHLSSTLPHAPPASTTKPSHLHSPIPPSSSAATASEQSTSVPAAQVAMPVTSHAPPPASTPAPFISHISASSSSLPVTRHPLHASETTGTDSKAAHSQTQPGQLGSAGEPGSDDLKNALFPVLLCAAAQMGSVDSLRALMDAGANANCYYDGRTPLHIAAREGHFKATQFLVQYCSAKVDALDRWNCTPLDDALSLAHTSVVEYLKSVNACESTAPTSRNSKSIDSSKPVGISRHPMQGGNS
jgi:lysophospholipase